MKAVCVWLTDRLDLQLHMYQLKTLIKIVKVNREKRDELSVRLRLLFYLPDPKPPFVRGVKRAAAADSEPDSLKKKKENICCGLIV